MKNKTRKWLKFGRLAGVLFVLGVLAFAISGSFAAYTNFNSVKRVVSTGTQSDALFGSNYLPLVSSVDEEYSVKRISLAEEDDNYYTFTVVVCNYTWGDSMSYNPKDITYNVTAQIVASDGGELPDISSVTMNDMNFSETGLCVLENEKLATGDSNMKEYRFKLPKSLKNTVRIQMVAEATPESMDAVNSQKLAAILSFADYEITKSWSGHFIDSRSSLDPKDYDAFNYEIYGNGAGTVTITWPDSLQLSKWSTNGKQEKGTYSFEVGETTTAIQFQFYRNPDDTLTDSITWDELENLITVTFKEKVDADENI